MFASRQVCQTRLVGHVRITLVSRTRQLGSRTDRVMLTCGVPPVSALQSSVQPGSPLSSPSSGPCCGQKHSALACSGQPRTQPSVSARLHGCTIWINSRCLLQSVDSSSTEPRQSCAAAHGKTALLKHVRRRWFIGAPHILYFRSCIRSPNRGSTLVPDCQPALPKTQVSPLEEHRCQSFLFGAVSDSCRATAIRSAQSNTENSYA